MKNKLLLLCLLALTCPLFSANPNNPQACPEIVDFQLFDDSGTPGDNVVCHNENLFFGVTAANGVQPYTYQWTATPAAAASFLGASDQNFAGAQFFNLTNNPISVLIQVKVTGNDGCFVTQTATVTVRPEMVTNIARIENSGTPNDGGVCFGDFITFNTNISPSGSYAFDWSDGSSGNPITVQPPFNNQNTLYYLTVTDNFGCTRQDLTSAKGITEMTANATPSSACGGGGNFITVTVAGGVPGPSGYLFLINGNPAGQFHQSPWQMPVFGNPGQTLVFSFEIRDEKGCTTFVSTSITIGGSSGGGVQASISATPAPDFCQGGLVGLTAQPSGDYSYQWNNGATDQSILFGNPGNTTARVTVTNSAGCTGTATYTYVLKNYPSAYTILAFQKASLNRATIASGGVGVTGNFWSAKAEFQNQSYATAAGTFARAKTVSVGGGSVVSTVYSNSAANVQIPDFQCNDYDDDNNVTVPQSANWTLGGTHYGHVKVKKQATLHFSTGSGALWLKALEVEDGGKVLFDHCLNVLVAEGVEMGKNCQFKTTNAADRAVAFVGEEFEADKGATVRGAIYAAEAIDIQGDANAPSTMTGMFIAPEIKSIGKTTWAMLPGCTECGGGSGKVAGNGQSGPNYVFLAQKKDSEAQFNFLSNRKEDELAYTVQRICPTENHWENLLRETAANSPTPERSYFEKFDPQPCSGDNLYRIEIQLKNGDRAYTKSRPLTFDFEGAWGLAPNPATDVLRVRFSEKMAAAQSAQIIVEDLVGREQGRISLTHSELQQPYALDLRKFRTGFFTLSLLVEGQREVAKHFAVVRE